MYYFIRFKGGFLFDQFLSSAVEYSVYINVPTENVVSGFEDIFMNAVTEHCNQKDVYDKIHKARYFPSTPPRPGKIKVDDILSISKI